MKRIYKHPETKKIISKAVYDQLTVLEIKKQELEEQQKALATQRAEIDKRLSEIQREGAEIPDVVREVVKAILVPIAKAFGFSAKELELVRPTPSDPVIRYKGQIICWYLISR